MLLKFSERDVANFMLVARPLVIEDAIKRSEAGQCPPPVYFYCLRSVAEPERSKAATILASVVRQLSCAEPGLPLLKPVVEKYERKGRGFSSSGLFVHESRELIIELVEHYSMTTIIVDALNKCEPKERQLLLDAFESA